MIQPRREQASFSMSREKINRGRLRAQIQVELIRPDEVCIFCPIEISERLSEQFSAKGFLTALPKRSIFGGYPQDFLIVRSTFELASAEVNEFVGNLPEPCYERDVP
jgi:hypothetical protein